MKNNIDFFYINLDRRTDRNKIFRSWCKDNNIKFSRFPAIEGAKIPNLNYDRIQGPLENGSDSVDSTNLKAKAGYFGCTKSHLELVNKIVNSNSKAEYIAIFEDDAIIEEKYINNFRHIVENIPSDAGAVYLGGGHRIRKGYLPISSTSKEFYELTSCFSTFAIIYRKKLLPAIRDLLKKDLELTKEEDGVYIIDKIFSALHSYLALNEIPEKNGLKILCEEFTKSCIKNKIPNFKWYGTNPFIVGNYEVDEKTNLSFSDINIGKTDYSNLLRVGINTNSFSKSKIIQLVKNVKAFKESPKTEEKNQELNEMLFNLSITENKNREYQKVMSRIKQTCDQIF